MAEVLSANAQAFALHYCTRSLEKAAFTQRISAAQFSGQVQMHCDDGADSQKLALDTLLGQSPAHTHLYVCGPQGFMDAVLGKARALGWPESALHFEFFSGQVVTHAADSSFQVEIASTGQRITIPKDVTVTHALAAAGVELMTACEQGVCGTCITRVLSGIPDHRDSYLSPDERAANDQFTPCCSRSLTPVLRLDL